MSATIDQPTDAWRKAALAEFGAQMRAALQQKRELAAKAREALPRLIDVMRASSGQSYKIRALLYSLWNGKDVSLLDLLVLDLPVRLDVLTVCAGFGWDGDKHEPAFFYKAIENAVIEAGLWDWWLEEAGPDEEEAAS